MGKDFHSRCDNIGPTISLFQVKDGDCIGGFTNAKWSSGFQFVGDNTAMLFNLQQERCFPHAKQKEYAILCESVKGPSFDGFGNSELSAYEPFNGERKCKSRANMLGYKIPI